MYRNQNFEAKWINDYQSLDKSLQSGLIELYRKCFSGHPYFEHYSDENVIDIFKEYHEKKSSILVLFSENAKTIGFSVKTPIAECHDILEVAGESVINKEQYFFGSDLGVDPAYRSKGLSFLLEDMQTKKLVRSYSHEITRTSASNYKRIAGNLKSGKRRLPYTEEVTMPRVDGSTQSDQRVYFEQALEVKKKADIDLSRVVIASPGGNDTAIVFDQTPRNQQGSLSKLIQENYPGVEQVMFVEKNDSGFYGQMAGGEFCGNATRSLAFILSKDGQLSENEEVNLAVSGSSSALKVCVRENNAQAQMPVKSESVNIREVSEGVSLVELEGISFIVFEQDTLYDQELSSRQSLDDKKLYVMDLLRKYSLDKKVASGVLSLSRKNSNVYMEPYVFVRDTQTLYYETACGSGTTAVGMLEAAKAGKSLKDLGIYQPSGKPILVSVDYDGENYYGASINGPVEILFDGSMPLNKKDNQPKNDNNMKNQL